MDQHVFPEAKTECPRADVRSSQETLIMWERPGEVVLGTAFSGIPKLPHMGKGLVINARVERIDSSPFWRDTVRCYLPATAWIEYVQQDGRNVPQEVAVPDGSPFLIAAVCGQRDGIRRMAMCMQDAPPRLAYLCDRLPLPYGWDVIRSSQPQQIIDRMGVDAQP